MLPDALRPLFWDVNTDTFDPVAHPGYTILRILEFGDRPAIHWMRRTFGEDEIRDVLRKDRRLTPRSANFWADVYKVPKEEVAALTQLADVAHRNHQ